MIEFSAERWMMRQIVRAFALACVVALAVVATSAQAPQTQQQVAAALVPHEGDYVAHDFHFKSGETLPELRVHYTTLGAPVRNSKGRTTNAVLILHGTGGSGSAFLNPLFAGVLFGPGQLLDASRYFIILPDGIGHGKSSKPSDGMHAHFPQYDYDDMVAAQHELVEKGLGVNHLRLVLGTSMGCMHSFVWGETYPDFMDALMPLACQAVEVAGRNRIWRKMVIDGIRNDPEWKGGDYTTEPRAAMEITADIEMIARSAPLQMQKNFPTRDAADTYLESYRVNNAKTFDANDFLYAVSASRNYDPSSQLEKITAPVMWINSGDDFINPPELTMAQTEVKRLKKGRFILVPASLETYGHGTHTHAEVWQEYLKGLLEESAR
jgi:homoserine O-acetyltransferase/O-succinyltransferase